MSVRFKFRSSLNYDSFDIGGQPWISVRDLKSRIVQSKKLNLCHDCDLLFSDPISGQEYVDEDVKILCGSSVIIKRVPAGERVSSHKTYAAKVANISKTFHLENVETVNFDDFGAELCPMPEGNLSAIDLDVENKFCIGDEQTIKLKRWSEQAEVGCHKLDVSDISEAIQQAEVASETKLKPDVELTTKLSEFPAIQTTDFPSEMKCSLCHSFFKEAVMIPCCQHSFCEKCIRHVLVEKARCPKCFSTKCKVEDLLPNVSLRQAIEHFLNSGILINDSENALHQYASDGESGIREKDVSCAVSVLQRGAELPSSSSSTGRGFNQVLAEPVSGMCYRVNWNNSLKDKISKLTDHNILQQVEDLEGFADSCGENQPINEEAESNFKKKMALSVNIEDTENSYMDTGKLKKGDRSCFLCGSPGHLRRDCPTLPSPHPMPQRGNTMFTGPMPGYASPYWNGPPFPNINFGANQYANSGMMPYNTIMIPSAPFPVLTYMPFMVCGSNAFGGFRRMGGIAAAMGDNIDPQLYGSELDIQDNDERHNLTKESVMRKHYYYEDDVKQPLCDEAERSFDKKYYPDRGRSASYSEDSFTKKLHMTCRNPHAVDGNLYSDDEGHEKCSQVAGRNPRPYHHLERSRSEVDDTPGSSSSHSEERHKYGHTSFKKRKIVEHNAERQCWERYNHSESSLEHNYSTHHKKRREKDSSRSSRHLGHKEKSARDQLSHGRWQMAIRSDEDNWEEHHYYKRKRIC